MDLRLGYPRGVNPFTGPAAKITHGEAKTCAHSGVSKNHDDRNQRYTCKNRNSILVYWLAFSLQMNLGAAPQLGYKRQHNGFARGGLWLRGIGGDETWTLKTPFTRCLTASASIS